MKKLLLFSFAACVMMNPLSSLAQKKKPVQQIIPAGTVLKTELDSISYAFGAMLYEQGLSMHLQQVGIFSDVDNLKNSYQSRIENETDALKKSALEKEMSMKLDSVAKVNEKNTTELMRGMRESLNASDAQTAYMTGIAIGGQIGKQMMPQLMSQLYGQDNKEKVNADAFLAAMRTAITKGKFELEDPSALFNAKMQEAQTKAQTQQDETLKTEYAALIAEGNKFMENNKTKDGVVVLPSGLQYRVLTKGAGSIPTASDRVVVHYKGMLSDGTVFDSSIDRGEPATFGVTQVIKGWTEALQLMPVGSKWELYIPYDLAYGSRGAGDKIKPFSNLIFEVELINIEE